MPQADQTRFGSPDLALPDELRAPLILHLDSLKERYLQRGWGSRVGFGRKPALIVIDPAWYWTRPDCQIGTDADSVVNAACEVLNAARDKGIPVSSPRLPMTPPILPAPRTASWSWT